MKSARLLVVTLVWLVCSVQIAYGQNGGGVDGGGGGGLNVPSRDRGGTKLTTLFKDGIAFLTEGDCKRAEKKFIAVLKKVPRNSEANYLRGISLQCQRKHKEAVRYFKRSKRDNVQFYQSYEALGISYLMLARPDLAEGELDALTEFKDLCQLGNRICPETLLKSHRKLLTAYTRVEGGDLGPTRGDAKQPQPKIGPDPNSER
jgi:tetratricopeptide (TPR) repeat protein